MNELSELAECRLCEHKCGVNRLAGERGICRSGPPAVAARMLHPAPPESYTIFLPGCNFKCLHCQNWEISRYPDNQVKWPDYVEAENLARESVEALASFPSRAMGADRIFFSGGEPTIHLPYIEQVVSEARKIEGNTKVNFDTNGFMTERTLSRVLDFTTSITFDLKAFFNETHLALTGAPVDPALRNSEIIARKEPDKIWEFRIVVIPGINEKDIEPLCRHIALFSKDLPVCFLAFRPNFVVEDFPGATKEPMLLCVETAESIGLTNVSWSGRTGFPGRITSTSPEMSNYYKRNDAALAGSMAAAGGCLTRPRNCTTCQHSDQCPLSRYRPSRNW